MNMSYGYDAVGNIKTLANAVTKGGATDYNFGYDDLYQLTSATGAFAKPGLATQKFSLAMSYDGIHNITRKTQTAFLALSNGSATPNVALSYDYAYAYAGGRPHAASQAGNHAFLYDLDGNQAGWNATDSYQNRRMVWDEDDRLQSVTDNNGQPTTFKYDGDTNRVVKKGAGGETLYINPWYVAALGRNSKQVFAGGTRIVTKLEISPTGEGYGPGAKNLKEVAQYFYHQDHLGSTGFVTDATGEVYQHLEYFPFGETWVDEVSDDLRVPYRFTGQEFDQETKLYYHGARYLDPRTSAWESADSANRLNPKLSPIGLNLYGYALQSPLRITDPDGRLEYDVQKQSFHITQGDTLSSIGKSTGVTGGALLNATPASRSFTSYARGLQPGTTINIPELPNIKTFKKAAAMLGDTNFKHHVPSPYDHYFDDRNKCNLYVSLSIEEGYGSHPTREGTQGEQVRALAADWYAANREGMSNVSQGDAVIGNVVSWKLPSLEIFGYNFLGASGHTTIYGGNVQVRDSSGTLHTPDGGWGTMGAGGDVGGVYRSADWLNNNSRYKANEAHFTRFQAQQPHE
jgi:RHS repeat-associated protein